MQNVEMTIALIKLPAHHTFFNILHDSYFFFPTPFSTAYTETLLRKKMLFEPDEIRQAILHRHCDLSLYQWTGVLQELIGNPK